MHKYLHIALGCLVGAGVATIGTRLFDSPAQPTTLAPDIAPSVRAVAHTFSQQTPNPATAERAAEPRLAEPAWTPPTPRSESARNTAPNAPLYPQASERKDSAIATRTSSAPAPALSALRGTPAILAETESGETDGVSVSITGHGSAGQAGITFDLAPGVRLPIAVLPMEGEFSPQQAQAIAAIGNEFADRVVAGAEAATDESVAQIWTAEQEAADSVFRVIFGDSAYNTRLMEAAIQAKGSRP